MAGDAEIYLRYATAVEQLCVDSFSKDQEQRVLLREHLRVAGAILVCSMETHLKEYGLAGSGPRLVSKTLLIPVPFLPC